MTTQSAIQQAKCHGCGGKRHPRKYLCLGCWHCLPLAARQALSRRDGSGMARLRELHSQLDDNVPLSEIRISP